MSPEILSIRDVRSILSEELGIPIAEVPYEEWIGDVERLARLTTSSSASGSSEEDFAVAMAPLLETFKELPFAERSGMRICFGADIGRHTGGTGADCLRRMVRWFGGTGFLPKSRV